MNLTTQEHLIFFCRHDISNMIKRRSQVEKPGSQQEMYEEDRYLCKPTITVVTGNEKSPACYMTDRAFRSGGYKFIKTSAGGNISAHI